MDFYDFKYHEKKWHEDCDKLNKEHESFIDYFDKHRTCRCDIAICRHLHKIEKTMFNPRYFELVNRHVIMGLNAMNEVIPGIFKESKSKPAIDSVNK